MHLPLETRRKKLFLGACLVYNHFRSSVSLCGFMIFNSVKMWSQISFHGDAAVIGRIMIFCNNQSDISWTNAATCALLKLTSQKYIQLRRNCQENINENLSNNLVN